MGILFKTFLAVSLLLTVSVTCAGQSFPVRTGGPTQPPACFDGTPHKITMVTVANGVQLQVLDWGGADKPDTMVLITGYGDNAHVYDGFAYQFTDYFHVIGITRRGFLPSSQPESGYDVETRAHDDIEVLKQLGISKAIFAGHSIAGSELSKLGMKYKSYIEKLIYLDAFDLAKRFELPAIPPPPRMPADYRSVQTLQAAEARFDNTLRPDPSICPGLHFDAKGTILGSTTPAYVDAQVFAGIAEKQNPVVDWAEIDAPRLGIFDQPSVQGRLPYYWYLNSSEQQVFDTNWPAIVEWYADTTAKFQQSHAGKVAPVVYLLPDAPHYFYISEEAFVVKVTREFLLGTVGH